MAISRPYISRFEKKVFGLARAVREHVQGEGAGESETVGAAAERHSDEEGIPGGGEKIPGAEQ